MEHRETIIKLFQYFFRKVTGYSRYVFSPTEKDLKSLDKFIDKLDSDYEGIQSIGYNFLFQYFTVAFKHQIEMKEYSKRFGKAVMFNWIIGDKAYKRWKNKSDNFWYFYRDFLTKYKISLQDNEVFEKVSEERIKELNNIERKRFYNLKRGLVNCILSGIFYVSNKHCLLCKWKLDCKKLKKLRDANRVRSSSFINKL